MGITATGLGSGLDINNIVNVLVDAEKLPKEAIFNKSNRDINTKVSSMGSLKSHLSTFQDTLDKLKDGHKLNQRTVTTNNDKYIQATANKNALQGSYDINVEQLAKNHKFGSAFVNDPTSTIGEGSLNFTVDGEAFSVNISDTDSLYDIADNIMNASGNSNVNASVLATDAGARIMLTGVFSGTDHEIQLIASDTVGTAISDLFSPSNTSLIQSPQNAIIHIDNQQITQQNNELTDVIEGVTLSLHEAEINETTHLVISPDDDGVKKNVESFVDAYNSLMQSINSLSTYDVDNEQSAALQGDSLIRSLESQLRNTISEQVAVDNSQLALYDIGISVDRYGLMSINDTKLTEAIANDMTKVEHLFATNTIGIANQLSDLVNSYVKTGGLIDNRNTGYQNEQIRLDEQRTAFELKMELLQKRLFKQFNTMDLMIAKLKQQSEGLVDRLNSLPGSVKK